MTKTYLVLGKLKMHFLPDTAWLSRAEKQTTPKHIGLKQEPFIYLHLFRLPI